MNKSEYRVLIVDDEVGLRAQITELLTAEGYQTLEAANAREAFQAVMKHAPHLIISDVRMPNGDGRDLLRLLEQNPDYATPVVFVSALLDSSENFLVESSLCRGCLSKPLNTVELLRQVEFILDH